MISARVSWVDQLVCCHDFTLRHWVSTQVHSEECELCNGCHGTGDAVNVRNEVRDRLAMTRGGAERSPYPYQRTRDISLGGPGIMVFPGRSMMFCSAIRDTW